MLLVSLELCNTLPTILVNMGAALSHGWPYGQDFCFYTALFQGIVGGFGEGLNESDA